MDTTPNHCENNTYKDINPIVNKVNNYGLIREIQAEIKHKNSCNYRREFFQ